MKGLDMRERERKGKWSWSFFSWCMHIYSHIVHFCCCRRCSSFYPQTFVSFLLYVSLTMSVKRRRRGTCHISTFVLAVDFLVPRTSSRSRSWHSISSVSHKKLKVMIVGWFWVIISSMIKNMLQIHALCQTEAEKKRKACKQEAGRPLNINPGDSSFHWLHSTEGKERRREKKYEGNTQKAKWSMKRGWEGLLAHLCLSTSKQTSFYSFSQRAKRDSRQRPWKYSLMYLHR